MKRLLLAINALLIPVFVFSQAAVDMSCQQNVFYGNVGNGTHGIELNSAGTGVTDLGIIAPTSGTFQLGSVAFANDFMLNSNNRTLYSTSIFSGNPKGVLKYTGSSWILIATDSMTFHNCGGYGNFLYVQHVAIGLPVNDQTIARVNANGTITPIFTDTTLAFSASDIAVDSLGNVYFFRGPTVGNTSELTVIDPTGAIIQSYSISLPNLPLMFGLFFMNGSLWFGQGTTNSVLYKVNLNGTTATLNSPITMNISMNDLAGCFEKTGEIISVGEIAFGNEFQCNFIKDENAIEFSNSLEGVMNYQISDVQGRIIERGTSIENKKKIYVKERGLIFVALNASGKRKTFRLMISE